MVKRITNNQATSRYIFIVSEHDIISLPPFVRKGKLHFHLNLFAVI